MADFRSKSAILVCPKNLLVNSIRCQHGVDMTFGLDKRLLFVG